MKLNIIIVMLLLIVGCSKNSNENITTSNENDISSDKDSTAKSCDGCIEVKDLSDARFYGEFSYTEDRTGSAAYCSTIGPNYWHEHYTFIGKNIFGIGSYGVTCGIASSYFSVYYEIEINGSQFRTRKLNSTGIYHGKGIPKDAFDLVYFEWKPMNGVWYEWNDYTFTSSGNFVVNGREYVKTK